MSDQPTPRQASPASSHTHEGEDSGVESAGPLAAPSSGEPTSSGRLPTPRPIKTSIAALAGSVTSLASSDGSSSSQTNSGDAFGPVSRRRTSLDVEPPLQPSSPLTPSSMHSNSPRPPRQPHAESSSSALEHASYAAPGRNVPPPRRQVYLNEQDEDPLLRSFESGSGLAIGGLRAVQPAAESPGLHAGPDEGMAPHGDSTEEDDEDAVEQPQPPIFTRTMSAPLPARVGRLRNPHAVLKPGVGIVPAPLPAGHSTNFSLSTARTASGPAATDTGLGLGHHRASSSDLHEASKSRALQTLSHELADSLQSAIQTLLHLAPPHLLDNAKEQYSGCTVQMPTTSLSALLTAMKGLNYLSANFRALCDDESVAAYNQVVDATPRTSANKSLPVLPDEGGNGSAAPAPDDGNPTALNPFGLPTLPFATSGVLDEAVRSASDDFDIGELLQSTADLLSGQAALAGVELVLFHGDVGIKHVSVKGDGEGLAYALNVVLRQILAVCKPGDCLELGLQVSLQSPSQTPKVNFPNSAANLQHRQRPMNRPSGVSEEETAGTVSPGETMRSQHSANSGPLLCTFEIVHNIRLFRPDGTASSLTTPRPDHRPGDDDPASGRTDAGQRSPPDFSGLLCRRIIRHVHASLREGVLNESPPLASAANSNMTQPKRTYEVSVLLATGEPIVEPTVLTAEEQAARQPFPSLRLAREPTLNELSDFAETLRGKRVELHASLQSVFARHLTNYLAAWGMDISHIPIEEDEDLEQAQTVVPKAGLTTRHDSGYGGSLGSRSPLRTPNSDNPAIEDTANGQDRLIIIDDDVSILKRQLLKMRAKSPILNIRPRNLKRPSLTTRAKSSPQVRSIQSALNASKSPPVAKRSAGVVIHFTSIANYNHVRDVVAVILAISPVSTFQQHEVMVIPKPVGPRRFLTALHTALDRPLVDPFFSPIATSPRSPGGGYFSNVPSRAPPAAEGVSTSQLGGVPEETSDDANSDDPLVTGIKGLSVHTGNSPRHPDPSHLQIATPSGEIIATSALEYFSEAVAKLGGSAAAGLMVQSPDGRPFGMYFDPPQRAEGRRGSYSQVPAQAPRRPVGKTPNFDAGPASSPGAVTSPNARRQSTMSQASSTAADSRRNSTFRDDPEDDEDHLERERRASSNAAKPQDSPVGAAAAARRRGQTTPVMPSSSFQPKNRDRSATLTSSTRPADPSRSTSPVPIDRTPSKPLPATPGVRDPESANVSPKATLTKPGGKKAAAIQARAAVRAQLAETAAAAAALAAKPPIAVKKSQAKEGVVVPPINVLIVEDNPINQNILSMFLRKKKIKHQTAKDGLEAVEKWKTGVFHLILMDIQLPVMDGIEATKEIRRFERSSNIGVFPATPSGEQPPSPIKTDLPPTTPLRSSVIIVALTASSLQADRVNALAAGCNDFLTKPVSLKWLENKIVEWGCMQALIDFEGWRRWKSADGKPNLEIKRAFQAGPDAKAKSVASRLRIDRTNKAASRSSSPSRTGGTAATEAPTAKPESPAVPGGNVPDIKVQQATPAPGNKQEETPSSAHEEGPGHTSLPNLSSEKVLGESQSGAAALHQGLLDAQKDQAEAQAEPLSSERSSGSTSSPETGTDTTPRPKGMPRVTSLASVPSEDDGMTPLAETAPAPAPSPHQARASIATDPETAGAPEMDPVTAPHLHHKLPGRILLDPELIEAGGADDGPEPKSEPSSNESSGPPIGAVPRIRKPSLASQRSEKELPPIPPA